MVSSPRNEKRGLVSCCWRSWRQRNDLSTARSRAGCPSLYRAIVETACPNDTRKRIGSLIPGSLPRSSRPSAARHLCAHLGISTLSGESDNGFRRGVVQPIRGNHGERSQHFRCRRAESRLSLSLIQL